MTASYSKNNYPNRKDRCALRPLGALSTPVRYQEIYAVSIVETVTRRAIAFNLFHWSDDHIGCYILQRNPPNVPRVTNLYAIALPLLGSVASLTKDDGPAILTCKRLQVPWWCIYVPFIHTQPSCESEHGILSLNQRPASPQQEVQKRAIAAQCCTHGS